MNYIKHLTGFFEKVSSDFDLNPTHISLYMAIFQLWNQNRFINPICISRQELMLISKIASNATYHKCIKELDERDFVRYLPSYNPFKGSILEVIDLEFYIKPIQKKLLKKNKIKHSSEHVNEQVLNKHCISTELLPYINNTNITNLLNGQPHIMKTKNDFLENDIPDGVESPKKKVREKKRCNPDDIPPNFEELQNYFKEKNSSLQEAEKFFNYYNSNGWLVGGKSKMKDWKASSNNWINNTGNFMPKNSIPKPNHLNTLIHKNYDEPL